MPLHKPHHAPHGSSVALTPLNSPTPGDGFKGKEKDKDKDPEATYESGDSDPAETGSLTHNMESATQWPETATQPTESEKVDAKKANLREDGTEYPSGVKLSLIMLAVCLAVFLMALE
ncbi:hypothetical protein PG997_003304 [Apiospora hydei]|uniref:Uncharacterized protein n=1 Tax=Apiospora hydei TaxID=1337664 RepID=A0ABR1WYV7_9PEZI